MKTLRTTNSLCPECKQVVPADIIEDQGKVWITKTCPEHGPYRDLYWGDYEQYVRAQRYSYKGKTPKENNGKTTNGCPNDCGLCPQHLSRTALVIIDVTNRCNLCCPICFAHAGATGNIYEPTKEQIKTLLESTIAQNSGMIPALQLSGGEPTVRDDLHEIVEIAREVGYVHIEVNTNGLRLAESLEYCKRLHDSGVNTIYLQFDGVTDKPYMVTRGKALFETKKKAINNLREAGFRSVVLVPTLIKGLNDDQIGDIIRFALENMDTIRGINFQPVALTGRLEIEQIREMRITIPDLITLAEKQTKGLVKKENWYPVSCSVPFSRFIGHQMGEDAMEFSVHPNCGMASYLIVNNGEVEQISDYLNVERFIRLIESLDDAPNVEEVLEEISDGLLRDFLAPLLEKGNYESLSELHHNMLMIGTMHFMDPYNFDTDRVKRCVIHYATLEGTLIPFCSMNNLHRTY